MNKEPPMSYFGCCNVRIYALAVSVFSIAYSILYIIVGAMTFVVSGLWAIICVSFPNIILVCSNILLIYGVLKRNILHVRIWLMVNSVYFIIMNSVIIYGKIVIYDRENITDLLNINLLIIDVMAVICYHPVYQYYKFEETCSKRTAKPVRQNDFIL